MFNNKSHKNNANHYFIFECITSIILTATTATAAIIKLSPSTPTLIKPAISLLALNSPALPAIIIGCALFALLLAFLSWNSTTRSSYTTTNFSRPTMGSYAPTFYSNPTPVPYVHRTQPYQHNHQPAQTHRSHTHTNAHTNTHQHTPGSTIHYPLMHGHR